MDEIFKMSEEPVVRGRKLSILGHVEGYTKQLDLDMVMFKDAGVNYCVQEFISNCCSR